MSNAFSAANYPTSEPSTLVIGDRWAWKRTDLGADYPPASYTLKYALRLDGAGDTEIEITATASGTDFLIEVAAATTAAKIAGRYSWQAYIVRNSDSERVTISSGAVDIRPNRDTSISDPRSHARRVLAAIEAVIEGTATREQKGYQIAGRSIEFRPIPELLALRDTYRAEVRNEEQAERVAKGFGDSRNIGVRFTRV